ncbi:MAG: low-specificity L-threonine aldolase [Candidatus Neomarinimicrobiota bacterium]|nr:low-specificity L-threonine aldolase [Candidatus Neomarinimicrobiota bacterium]
MNTVDLRSDTVTLPTGAMRQAILNAELGDDVFEEDPTINDFEEKAASLFGKDAALLVPSGTMANLVSVLAHCDRGTEVILGDKAHTYMYEAGGIAAFGGVHPRTLKNLDDGTIDLEEIRGAIRPDNVHFPQTALIGLENSHNVCHGSPLTKDYIDEVAAIGQENGLPLHIDGARIFNASVALNTTVKDLSENADSVSFCLSKGLSCPVGSVVCGSEKFINKARRIRKGLGGGMRQAGVLAAAGIVALDEMIDRLKVDHANARRLASGIDTIDGLTVQINLVKTNIVYVSLDDSAKTPEEVVAAMKEKNIKFFTVGPAQFRMVTNSGIDAKGIDRALKELSSYFASA